MVLRKIKNVILRMIYYGDCIRWWYGYKSVLENRNRSTFENIEGNNILFMVPHADDDLLGGYKFLTMYKDSLRLAYFGKLGSNIDLNNKRIRDKEFSDFCMELGLSYIEVKEEELERLLEEKCIIVLPSIVDWHEEHRKLNYILYDALEKKKELINACRIIWYSVTVPLCDDRYRIVSMTRKEQKDKYSLFNRIYVSQRFMPVYRFKSQERINAAGSGYYAGEAFCELSFDEWKEIVKFIRTNEPNADIVGDIVKLRLYINDIRRIRQESNRIYNKIYGCVRNKRYG